MATKAKRKLSEISFQQDGAHIALVSKQQGGPANNADYALVLKGNKFSEEYIEKMQQVKVTMELPDFLRKFFSVYYEDAEVLARMMGYVPPTPEVSNQDYSYEDYVQSKLDSFEVLKAVYDAESIADVLSGLDETEYLAMLQDQSLVEKALKKIDKQQAEEVKQVEKSTKESGKEAQATKPENSTNASVEKNVEPTGSEVTKSKEEKMTLKAEVKTEVEMIEKSALVDIQKALDAQKEELQKALNVIAQFEQKEKEQVQKAKSDKFVAVVKDEKVRSAIVKAGLSLESDEDFDAFLAAITAMANSIETSQGFIEKSALFQEQGATVETEVPEQESAVARILKAKLAK